MSFTFCVENFCEYLPTKGKAKTKRQHDVLNDDLKKWVTIFFTLTPAKITHRPTIGNANSMIALNVYLKMLHYSPFESLNQNKLTNIFKTSNTLAATLKTWRPDEILVVS